MNKKCKGVRKKCIGKKMERLLTNQYLKKIDTDIEKLEAALASINNEEGYFIEKTKKL